MIDYPVKWYDRAFELASDVINENFTARKVFDFVQSLQANSLFQKWDNISEEESQALQAEFAQEDIDFSENILADYLAHLKEVEEG